MATPSQLHSYSEDFAFQFDAPFPSIAYDKYLSWSGWLVHRHGKPIHGLRAVVRRTLLGRRIIRARRKRERPDVATAFPNLTEAKTSGFLFELQLGLGTNYLTFQVQDQRHVWRTFCTTTIRAAPLNFLDLLGFRQSRSVLTRILQSWAYDRAQRVVHLLPRQLTDPQARSLNASTYLQLQNRISSFARLASWSQPAFARSAARPESD